MSEPEMDSAENPWFVNCANVLISIFIQQISYPIWFIFAVFDCHDSWWQTVMGFQLFPPGVISWNEDPRNTQVAYGEWIKDRDGYEAPDYTQFYNTREDSS